MTTHRQRVQHVEHNEKLLEAFKRHGLLPEFADWYVTVIFYTAVQHIEAMLYEVKPVIRETMGQKRTVEHTNSHDERLQVINISFADIQVDYMPLYVRSRAAKYHNYDTPGYAIALSEKNLERIKAMCRKYILRVGR